MLSPEALAELVDLVAAEVERRRNDVTSAVATPGLWMTVAEAAEYLRCKPQRIRDLRSSRRLTPYTEGGRALCDRREVESLVQEVEDRADNAGGPATCQRPGP